MEYLGLESIEKSDAAPSNHTDTEEDDDEPTEPLLLNLGRILNFTWPLRWWIIFGCISSSLDATATALGNYLVGQIVDTFGGALDENAFAEFQDLLLQLTIAYAIEALFSFLAAFSFRSAGHRIGVSLQEKTFAALVRKKMGFFDSAKTGELSTRLSHDCPATGSLISTLFPDVFVSVGMTLFNLFFLIYISWRLSLALFITLPFIGAAMWTQARMEKSNFKLQSELAENSNHKSLETLSNIRTVRLFGQESKEVASYREIIFGAKSAQLARSIAIVQSLASTWVTFALNLCVVVVFWVGGKSVFTTVDGSGERELSGGKIISFSLFALNLTEQVGSAPDILSRFNQLLVYIEKISAIIGDAETAGDAARHHDEETVIRALKGDIEFKSVTFSYPTRPEIRALSDFSLKIRAGTRCALVGKTGSGKSTVASLLSRLYEDGYSGEILIDGMDLKRIPEKVLRRFLFVVSQESAIFSGSVRDNILYSLSKEEIESIPRDVLQSRIENAAKLANAHEFIMSQLGGYETTEADDSSTAVSLGGERGGATLSGGQRQRIAIARAILKNPSILITDEATSALDVSTEKLIQESLEHVMRGRTCIVIAHRLATVLKCDLIVVVDEGKVAESGTHEELMSRRGIYWQMVQNQLGNDSLIS